ncbi:hypothetical protein D3C83_43410 [compost metagenome]
MALPDAGAVVARRQRAGAGVPAIEVAHHRNRFRVRCPDGKPGAAFFSGWREMAAKLLVKAGMAAFLEKVDVVIREEVAATRRGFLSGNRRVHDVCGRAQANLLPGLRVITL